MTPEREADIREILSSNANPAHVRVESAAHDLLAALDAERKAHEETRRNGREDRNLLLRVVEHIASRVGMEPEGLWEDPSSIEHGLASVRAAACAEADLAHHHTMGLLLEARESLRQLEREYRCAECLHNVARAEQAKAVLADVRQRCGGYPDSRVDGDGGIVAVVVRERDDARRSIACARYCLENDHGEAAVRACLDGMGMAPGIAEEYQSDLDRVTRERDEARETARRDADLRDDAEQQRNRAQAALVAAEAAREMAEHDADAMEERAETAEAAPVALREAAARVGDLQEDRAWLKYFLAATPATLAGQVRARVLRETIADVSDTEFVPDLIDRLRALADEAEKTR